jgi:hypothetical protein
LVCRDSGDGHPEPPADRHHEQGDGVARVLLMNRAAA